MPKVRKKKTPVTAADASGSSSSRPQASRTVIRKFHVLLKSHARLQSAPSHNAVNAEKARALSQIEQEIEALGGLDTYQRMSTIGQGNDRGGGSQKVLVEWLNELGIPEKHRGPSPKLRLLEVGALKPDNYRSCISWIDPSPIDLKSRHPIIKEQDFLLMNEDEHRGAWDVISLSLVINFVPRPKDRGRMLCLAHAMLSTGGLLFLALPLPCVANSRYLTMEHLQALMRSLGFDEIQCKWKNGGKMAYWLYRAVEKISSDQPKFHKKSILRTGNRNNFCILL